MSDPEAQLWNRFVDKLHALKGLPLTESAARQLLAQCAQEGLLKSGAHTFGGQYWAKIGFFLRSNQTDKRTVVAENVGRVVGVPASRVRIGESVLKRVAVARRCESPEHRKTKEQPNQDELAFKETSAAFKRALAAEIYQQGFDSKPVPINSPSIHQAPLPIKSSVSPSVPENPSTYTQKVPPARERRARPPTPLISLCDQQAIDWCKDESEIYTELFRGVDILVNSGMAQGLSVGKDDPHPTVSVPDSGMPSSFAAWELLKTALLLRVAAAPSDWPKVQGPPIWEGVGSALSELYPRKIGEDGGMGVKVERVGDDQSTSSAHNFEPSSSPSEIPDNEKLPATIGALVSAALDSEWLEAAKSFVTASRRSALAAVKVAVDRAGTYYPNGSISGREGGIAGQLEIGQLILQGEFRRFCIVELFPLIRSRRSQRVAESAKTLYNFSS